MKELYRLLGIKLAATTAYHPQGNGQTERANQELEQYLHLFSIKDKMTGSDFFYSQNSSITIIYTPQPNNLLSF
jgi:hypothetical protein